MERMAKTSPSSSRLSTSLQVIIVNFDFMVVLKMMSSFLIGVPILSLWWPCEDICTSSKSSIVIGAANFISDIGSDGVVRSTRELVVVPKNPAVSFPRIVNNHQGCRLYQFLLDTFLVCRSPYKWRGYQSRVGNFIATLCTATVTVGLLIFTGFSV